ncbi:MAG: hypothetical protein C4547_02825 [Phycisphaerales bacterium]|nr:MAG: hypothetical protein C4547_02825 [Phycisphaerales bacterium]
MRSFGFPRGGASFPLAGLSVALLAAGCSIEFNPDRTTTVSRRLNQTIPQPDIGSLDIDALNGDITITVDPAEGVMRLTAIRRATSRSQALAESAVDQIEVGIRVAESQPPHVFIDVDAPPDDEFTSYEVEFEIVIPAGMLIDVNGERGDVTIDGNDGQVSVRLRERGNITVRDQTGDVIARSGAGSVSVTTQTGDVEVVTTTGRVSVATGEGSVEVENTSGDVGITASPVPGGAVIAASVSGGISVQVPTGFAAELFMSTIAGNLAFDFAGFDTEDVNVDFERRRVTATLNGGGGQIELQTQFGDVDFEGF